MKEYTYQLEKDDYREWIQWNIKKHDQKKVRYITVGVMMALLAMTLIGNLSSGAPLALLRHQSHAGLVALPFRAPVVGVDGEFARGLDVHAADVTDTEIDPCLVGDVVLGGGLPDECGHFHMYVLLSVLVYHVHKPALHVIVYRAVAAERPAALHMPRHRGDKVWVGHLPV